MSDERLKRLAMAGVRGGTAGNSTLLLRNAGLRPGPFLVSKVKHVGSEFHVPRHTQIATSRRSAETIHHLTRDQSFEQKDAERTEKKQRLLTSLTNGGRIPRLVTQSDTLRPPQISAYPFVFSAVSC